MERPRAVAIDGLLVVIHCTGIPVLVRTYGEVQKPPSATIGIVSAVFHAARTGDAAELRTLRSAHRNVVYLLEKGDILLAIVKESGKNEIASGMLRILFRALQISIGPSVIELESPKLRVALSRNLALIDYVVSNYATDPRLSLELPVFAVDCVREAIDTSHQPSLIYAAASLDGITRLEFGSAVATRTSRLDIAILFIIGEINAGVNTLWTTVCVDIVLKVAGIKSSAGWCLVGIFASDVNPSAIEEFLFRYEERLVKMVFVEPPTAPPQLCSRLPPSLLCCYVVPFLQAQKSSAIESCAIAFELSCKQNDKPPGAQWWLLNRFVQKHHASKTLKIDFKQEYEDHTFICSIREPILIYATCRGSLSLSSTVAMGDAMASWFLSMGT